MRFCREYGIDTLPSYLLQYNEKAILIKGLIGYDGFAQAIDRLTGGKVQPHGVKPTVNALREIIKRHPLISLIEIREAFDLNTNEEVMGLLKPLLSSGEIAVKKVYHGQFIERRQEK